MKRLLAAAVLGAVLTGVMVGPVFAAGRQDTTITITCTGSFLGTVTYTVDDSAHFGATTVVGVYNIVNPLGETCSIA